MKTLPSISLMRLASLAPLALIAACATAPGTGAGSNTQSPTTPTSTPAPSGGGGVGPVSSASTRWPVKTGEHIDLWLHSFALITQDTTPVPLFKRGYRDSVQALRRRSNTITALDANRDALMRRMTTNPALVQAQFLALQFANFADLKRGIEALLQFQGDPSRAPDRNTAAVVQQLAATFPTAADRDWIRLFLAGVVDEQSRYYTAEYQRVKASRSAVINAVESTWQNTYRPKFDRFLNNTSQRIGEMYLALPLGPEGRTSGGGPGGTIVVVPFPERTQDAVQPILVLAHEVTGNMVGSVVSDNTTPAQQRDGSSGTFIAYGQVIGGMQLLQKIAPELVDSYCRYYLAQVGRSTSAANVQAALKSAFPIPQAISDALARQIDIVLAGI